MVGKPALPDSVKDGLFETSEHSNAFASTKSAGNITSAKSTAAIVIN